MTALGTGVAAGSTKPAARRRPGKRLTFDRITFFLVFLVVPVGFYAAFVLSPFAQAVWYSFTDWSGFSSTMNFVGGSNYVDLLSNDKFLTAVRNSVTLGVVLPFVTILLSLVLATFVTVGGSSHGKVRGLRNSSFYRVVSFFPYVVPAIIIGLIWQQIYDPSAGILNGILTKLGFEQFESFPWLGDSRTALVAVMFAIVWGFVGFYMVLFVAAIKGIPAELFEAARIDGAGRFRTATSITIPMIRDNLQTAYIYMGILSLDSFVYMAAMNPNGTNDATLVISQELLETAFGKSKFGLACAMGVTLAVITLVFAGIVILVNRLTGGREDVTE